MTIYSAHLNNGTCIPLKNEFCIGDVVSILDGSDQYSSYSNAFEHFWRENKVYEVPYRYTKRKPRKKSNVELNNKQNTWIIAGAAVHSYDHSRIVFHLRSRDYKNCVFSSNGLSLIKESKKRGQVLEINQIRRD